MCGIYSYNTMAELSTSFFKFKECVMWFYTQMKMSVEIDKESFQPCLWIQLTALVYKPNVSINLEVLLEVTKRG